MVNPHTSYGVAVAMNRQTDDQSYLHKNEIFSSFAGSPGERATCCGSSHSYCFESYYTFLLHCKFALQFRFRLSTPVIDCLLINCIIIIDALHMHIAPIRKMVNEKLHLDSSTLPGSSPPSLSLRTILNAWRLCWHTIRFRVDSFGHHAYLFMTVRSPSLSLTFFIRIPSDMTETGNWLLGETAEKRAK